MADSLKSRWTVSGTENCSCLASTECTRDECRGEASGSELSHAEGLDTANTQVSSHGSLDVGRATPEPPQSRGIVTLNPAGWDTFRRTSGFYSTPATSLTNIQAHVVDLTAPPSSVNVTAPILDHLGPVTPLRETHTANASIDHSSRPYNVPYTFLPSAPPPRLTSPLSSARRSPYHIPTGLSALIPLPPGQDDLTAPSPHPQTLTQSLSNTLVSAPDTTHDHLHSNVQYHSRVQPWSHSRVDRTETLGVGREISPLHNLGLTQLGSADREQELFGLFGPSGPPPRSIVLEPPAAQEDYAARGSHYPRPSSSLGLSPSTSLVRRASTGSQPRRSLDTEIDPHRTGDEDGDGLPALLPMSDGSDSEQGRPLSPDASTLSSLSTNEDTMTRFLHPGTPIQTELPEIQSLLHQFQTGERIPMHHVWRLPEARTSGDYLDSQISWEDDFAGDLERARELLEGLELVDDELVERYQKVRGDGDDICTVCRDYLLRPNNADKSGVEEAQLDAVATENFSASTELPFQPPCSEMSIYAFPCTHLFHMDCLLPWLSLKTTCPTCRLDLDPQSHTLRVRGWGVAFWSQGIGPPREYVNTDDFGRRIPWKRPPAPSLEEWVCQRELEILKQKEKRMDPSPHSRRDVHETEASNRPQTLLTFENVLSRFARPASLEGTNSASTREHDIPREPRHDRELDSLSEVILAGESDRNRNLWQGYSLRFPGPPLHENSAFLRRGYLPRPNILLNGPWRPSTLRSPGETNWPQSASVAALSSSGEGQGLSPPAQNSASPTIPYSALNQNPITRSTANAGSASISASRHTAFARALEISRNIGDLLDRARGTGRTNNSLNRPVSPQTESVAIGPSTTPIPPRTSALPEMLDRAGPPRSRSDPLTRPRQPNVTQGATANTDGRQMSMDATTFNMRGIGAVHSMEDVQSYNL